MALSSSARLAYPYRPHDVGRLTAQPNERITFHLVQPRFGDVLVRRDLANGTLQYVISVMPRANQIAVTDRSTAIIEAVSFAELQQVRAWLIEGGSQTLLTQLGRRSRGQL